MLTKPIVAAIAEDPGKEVRAEPGEPHDAAYREDDPTRVQALRHDQGGQHQRQVGRGARQIIELFAGERKAVN